jgi:hypothetical protein
MDRAGSALTVWEMTKSGAKKTEVAQKSAARFVEALDAVEDAFCQSIAKWRRSG